MKSVILIRELAIASKNQAARFPFSLQEELPRIIKEFFLEQQRNTIFPFQILNFSRKYLVC